MPKQVSRAPWTLILLGCNLVLLALTTASVSAQEYKTSSPVEEPFTALDGDGIQATRSKYAVFLELEDSIDQVSVPRLAASLKSVAWEGADEEASTVKLQVEQDEWILSWPKRPESAQRLVLRFDSTPWLLSELKPIAQSGDGSFLLPACLATTAGEKVRYEPQTFKNTVGYWVGKEDSATWTIRLNAAGKFNVGILQGCGTNQGGSQAKITFASADESMELEFEIKETGHFQNFQWCHLGEIDLGMSGDVTITVEPVKIANKALVDIRQIQLIRLPVSAKKR